MTVLLGSPTLRPITMSDALPAYYGWKLAACVLALVASLSLTLRWRRSRRLARRSVLVPHVLLSGSCVVGLLLLAEGAFFLWYDQTDSFLLTNTSKRWFARHVRKNNFGCRDEREFTPVRPPGVFRIALLGDSFAFGQGIADVRDRFGDRLEYRLNEDAPGRFEVYNLSHCGDESQDHRMWLRALMRGGFECDMVLLAYTLNDASPWLPEFQAVYQRVDALKPRCWLFRDTYLFNQLYYRVALVTVPETRTYYAGVARAYREPIWSRHRAELEQIAAECRSAGLPLRVLTFPLVSHVGPDYPLLDAHQTLGQLWAELDVPHVDLLEAFGGRSAAELVVSRMDGHPSVLAHKIAADAIFEQLLATDPIVETARRGQAGPGTNDVQRSGEESTDEPARSGP